MVVLIHAPSARQTAPGVGEKDEVPLVGRYQEPSKIGGEQLLLVIGGVQPTHLLRRDGWVSFRCEKPDEIRVDIGVEEDLGHGA